MKLFTILLFFVTLSSFTDDAKDEYFLCETENKEGYYLWRGDTLGFTWFKFHSDVKEFGQGTFEQTSDSIILTFGPARKQFDTEESSNPVARGNESVEIVFTNVTGEPIEGLEVKLEKSGLKAMTDASGVAQLHTRAVENNKDEIGFRFENYRTYHQSIDLKRRHYNFRVVADKGRKYKENQFEKLKFTIKGSGFEINDGENKKYFRRVTRNRFLDLYHGFKK